MKKVLSDQKFPVKMWLDDLEESALEQVKNLANLPFIYKHVAIMPDSHTGFGMPIGGVLATDIQYIIPNAVGVDIGCFTGETKIPLIDGTVETLFDLSKKSEPFYVYSITEDNVPTAGLAICKKTRENAELLEITLDNNEKIKCTPDHQFLLRDGTYIEASLLKEEDSLMPFSHFYDKDGYDKVYNPKTKTVQVMHWLMARTGVLGEIKKFENQKTIIHHIDFTKSNNSPLNLKFMGDKEHVLYHRSLAERNLSWQSPEFEKKRIEVLQKKIKEDENYLKYKQEIARKNILSYISGSHDLFIENCKENGERGKKYLISYNKSEKGRAKSKEISNRIYTCEICGKEYKGPSSFSHHKKKEHNNHKIIKIIKLEEKSDVYCLNVEKYHNFALSAGIFVHNCGMCAVKTNKKASEISKETYKEIMGKIRQRIPVGMNHHKQDQDIGLEIPIEYYVVHTQKDSIKKQIGTLGGGNHFIELQKDVITDDLWVMIHSGSRNLGKQVAEYYNKKAIEENQKYFSSIPLEWKLAFLRMDTIKGVDYYQEMQYCMKFAYKNRLTMIERILEIMSDYSIEKANDIINIAHNYASMEEHFGKKVMIHRKGATLAEVGTIGIIPGSQGTKSYIVEGLGNRDSFNSCSHGAGRKMSRTRAQNELNLEEEIRKLNELGVIHGIRNQKDLDEASSAYKDINIVMENQKDLVKILVELQPIGVIKG